MAYPLSEGLKSSLVRDIDASLARIKAAVSDLSDRSALGNTARIEYVGVLSQLTSYINFLNTVSSVPGMGDAIVADKPTFTGDAVAELITVRDAAITLRDWLFGALQVPLYDDPDINGDRAPLQLTSAQTAVFRTNSAAFLATIG